MKIEQHGGLCVLWCIGWLFTIGFLTTGFWKGFLALLVWPYFIGAEFAPSARAGEQPAQNQHAQ